MPCLKIRKLDDELDGKPLAELIRLDDRLIVAIDEKEKKMVVLNEFRVRRLLINFSIV
ncbi:MAG: hypothetical protein PQ964_00780 [Methanobacteriaceae archaeon]|jgi:hypothetical protein